MALTPKQARFVEEYLVDLNATQAAIRAGYSERTANEQGARLLANASVQAAIAAAVEARSKSTGITAGRVLQEYARIALLDPRKATRWTDGTMRLVSSDEIDDDTAAAISEISIDKDGRVKLKFWPKVGALDSIGKHLQMFIERREISGPDGGPIKVEGLTDEQLHALINKLSPAGPTR